MKLAPGLGDVPDLVPARMVNEFTYCPRLFLLEWVQARFADNDDTVEGRWQHRVVDKEGAAAPLPGEGDLRSARSVQLSSSELGLVAKVDLIEGHDSAVCPVGYKRGSPRDNPAIVGARTGAAVRGWPACSCATPATAVTRGSCTSPRRASGSPSPSTLRSSNVPAVKASDFVVRAGGVALTPSGRKTVLHAYERRLDTDVTHPTFGYKITYRRTLEVQARLLGAHLLGEVPEYVPFMTR